MGRRSRIQIVLVLLLLVSLLLAVNSAQAHANLVRSEPAANSVLDAAPTRVRLWFSEMPEAGISQIQVLDRAGKVLAGMGQAHIDPDDSRAISISLPVLKPGLYTVGWRVVSAMDGHFTTGGFAFAVGHDQVPAGGLKGNLKDIQSSGSSPTPANVAVRWLSYLGMAFLMGGFAFSPLVFTPTLVALIRRQLNSASRKAEHTPDVRSLTKETGLFRVFWVGWLMLLGATIGGLLLQTADVGGNLLILLTGTHYGLLFWLRLLIIVLLGVLLATRESPRWLSLRQSYWWILGMVLTVILLLATSLGSHAAAMTEPFLPVISDWLHLVAMGVWLGGLVALALTLLWLRRTERAASAPLMAGLVSRFSQVATVCVAVLAVTGMLQALFQLGDVANLIDSEFGATLLLKLAMLVPLLGVAAINLLVIRQGMVQAMRGTTSDAIQPWYRLIRRTVAAEIIFVVAILLLTGILTNLPPAREAFGSGLVARGQAGDLRVIVAANPGLPGLNTFDIYLRDSWNRPLDSAQKVALIFSMIEQDLGKTEVAAERADTGHYVVQGNYTAMLGTWQAEVLVRRSDHDDVYSTLVLPMSEPRLQVGNPVLVSPARFMVGLEVLIMGSLLFIGSRRLARAQQWAGRTALIGGLGVITLGVGVLTSGFTTAMDPFMDISSPIPADAISVGRGLHIYMDNCESCHGRTGTGDGPLSTKLNPPPANLQVHMAAGHSDGQLFDWVTNGIVGSAMPPYGNRLSDNDTWDVINYIRTFAAKTQ